MNRPKLQLITLVMFGSAAFLVAQTGSSNPAANGAGVPPSSTGRQRSGLDAPAAASQSAASGASSNVPPDAPVITVNGVCEVTLNGTPKQAPKTGAAASGSDCKTQITRAEFEKLVNAVAPGAPPTARRQIAAGYVQLLSYADQGVKLGVDKDPEFSEQLAAMKLQLLAQSAARKIQAQASNVSDAEVKSYYDQNSSGFEEVTLTRIFVPRSATESAQGQAVPDSKAIADAARQQLVAGADPEAIQKTVFTQLKTTTEPPSTKFGAKRRGTLPPAHEQKVFALKQGDVSEVIPDSIGYVIYRVDARRQVPFDQVKDDVKRRVTQQRIEDARQHFTASSKADYNDSYFGPEGGNSKGGPGGPPSAPRPGPPAARGAPPSASSNPSQQAQPSTPK